MLELKNDYDFEFVFLITSINEKMIKIKGKTQINKGLLILKKSFLSKYLPSNKSNIKAIDHCDARPANLDH
jgi:hypothetical protein